MSEIAPVLKDEHNHISVPSMWRSTLADIVEAFKDGDFLIARTIAGVRPIPSKDAARIAENIKDYGARLISLPDSAWQTSVCQWMRGYWGVLVDLHTESEGRSDLVLSMSVYEEGSAYIFEVEDVHVP